MNRQSRSASPHGPDINCSGGPASTCFRKSSSDCHSRAFDNSQAGWSGLSGSTGHAPSAGRARSPVRIRSTMFSVHTAMWSTISHIPFVSGPGRQSASSTDTPSSASANGFSQSSCRYTYSQAVRTWLFTCSLSTVSIPTRSMTDRLTRRLRGRSRLARALTTGLCPRHGSAAPRPCAGRQSGSAVTRVKVLLVHIEQHHALDQSNERRNVGPAEKDGKDARRGIAEVKVLDAQASQQKGEQSGRHLLLVRAIADRHVPGSRSVLNDYLLHRRLVGVHVGKRSGWSQRCGAIRTGNSPMHDPLAASRALDVRYRHDRSDGLLHWNGARQRKAIQPRPRVVRRRQTGLWGAPRAASAERAQPVSAARANGAARLSESRAVWKLVSTPGTECCVRRADTLAPRALLVCETHRPIPPSP